MIFTDANYLGLISALRRLVRGKIEFSGLGAYGSPVLVDGFSLFGRKAMVAGRRHRALELFSVEELSLLLWRSLLT